MHQTITITLSLESLAYVAGAAILLLALPGLASAYWRGRVTSKFHSVEWRLADLRDSIEGIIKDLGEVRGLLGGCSEDEEGEDE